MTWDLSQTLLEIEHARGLPNDAYWDEDFFALEKARIFHGGWSCVAVASELPKPGDLLPVELAGAPILLTHGSDGEIRAFHNVCRHRGVRLVTEKQNGKRIITCPYHAWAYGLEGACRATPKIGGPDQHEVENLNKAELGLFPIRLARWFDFLFVDLSGKAAPFEDFIAPLAKRWAHYDLSLLRHAGFNDFETNANWKLATENTVEFYHLPSVHPALEGYSPSEAHYFCDDEPFVGTATRAYQPILSSGQSLPRFPGLTEEQLTVGEYPVVVPNLWLGVQSDHFFALVVYPDGPAKTRERQHIYFIGDEAMTDELEPVRQETLTRWRQVNSEDLGIVAELQQGRRATAFDGGCFSPYQDYASHVFQRWVAERLSQLG